MDTVPALGVAKAPGPAARRHRTGPSRNGVAWVVALSYGAVVSYLHFELGLADRLYWSVPWWDLLTHSAAGFGVAAVVYLLAPRLFRSPVALLVTVPMIVLAAGAWFEVYERVFRTFWYDWTYAQYTQDTLVDLVMDGLGAVVFALVVLSHRGLAAAARASRRALRDWRAPTGRDSGADRPLREAIGGRNRSTSRVDSATRPGSRHTEPARTPTTLLVGSRRAVRA